MRFRRWHLLGSAAVVLAVLLSLVVVGSSSGSAASLGGLAPNSLYATSSNSPAPTPGFQATPSSIDFGVVEVDVTAGPTAITITNTGTGSLTFITGGVTLVGADAGQFSVTSETCSASTLPPSGTCVVNVDFTPTTTGLKTASVRFENSLGATYFVGLQGTGNVTNFSYTPLPVFGGVVVGDDSTIEVTLSKSGGPGVTFGAFTIVGPNASDFSVNTATIDPCDSFGGGPQSCIFEIIFSPTGPGLRTATLEVNSNRPNSPDLLGLSGTGLAPTFSAAPNPVNFGTEDVGDTTPPTTVTVTNTGTATLAFGPSAVSIVGGNDGDFDIDVDNCSNQNVAPSATCTVDVTFTPTASGSRTSTLRFDSNAASSPDDVTLNGTGAAAPAFSAAPDPADFGNQVVSTTSSALTVTVTNTGTADLDFGPAAVSVVGGDAADFDIDLDGCSTQSLAPAQTCDVDVTFTPSATGPRTSNLRFVSNATSSPNDVTLAGTGINANAPAFSVAPTSFDFGNVNVGGDSTPTTLTVTNTGNSGLVFGPGSVTVNTGDTADFEILSDTCSDDTVAPAATCEVQIRFGPTATGARSSTIRFVSNAASSPDAVPVQGFGTQPAFSASTSSFDYRTQARTTSSGGQTVTITNTGDGTLTWTSVALTGTNPGDFDIDTDTCTGSLAPDDTCVVTVSFSPTALGVRTANVTFTSDAPGSPHSVAVSGWGSYLSISDNFNRSNRNNLTGGPTVDPVAPAAPWTIPSGSWRINSNRAEGRSLRSVATVEWGGPDASVSINLSNFPNNNTTWAGLLINADGTSATVVRVSTRNSNPNVELGTLVYSTGNVTTFNCDSGQSTKARPSPNADLAGVWTITYYDGLYEVFVPDPDESSPFMTCQVSSVDQAVIDQRTRVGMYASQSSGIRFDNFSVAPAPIP